MSSSPTQNGVVRPAGFMRRHGVKLVSSLVIAAAFVFALRRGGLPIVPDAGSLARVDVTSIVLCTALTMLWNYIRAARWRHLISPIADIPLRRTVGVAWIGFAAILIMPLRAGEIVRPYLIREKGKLSVAAATGTVGAERIIDGLFLTVTLGLCLQLAAPLSPLPDHIGKLQIPVAAVPFYSYLALFGFLAAFALMGVFYLRPAFGHVLVERSVGVFSRNLARKCADFVARMADGLKFLPSLKHTGPFMVETTAYWILNAFSMWMLARGCGIADLGLLQCWTVMGVLGVGILVPAGPGLFGAFQASLYAGLAMYLHDGVVLGPGALFVFFLYVIQCICTLLGAGLFLALLRGSARDMLEAESA